MLAACRAGMATVVLPASNEADVGESFPGELPHRHQRALRQHDGPGARGGVARCRDVARGGPARFRAAVRHPRARDGALKDHPTTVVKTSAS